jgi:hypothetical protein
MLHLGEQALTAERNGKSSIRTPSDCGKGHRHRVQFPKVKHFLISKFILDVLNRMCCRHPFWVCEFGVHRAGFAFYTCTSCGKRRLFSADNIPVNHMESGHMKSFHDIAKGKDETTYFYG